MPTYLWAAWGLLGAFVHAGLALPVAWAEAKASGRPLALPLGQFIVALCIGLIFGAGFGPIAGDRLGLKTMPELQALALVVGLVANPIAPWVVKVMSGASIKVIQRFLPAAEDSTK